MKSCNRLFLLFCLFTVGFSLQCSLEINDVILFVTKKAWPFVKRKTGNTISALSHPAIMVPAGKVVYELANWGLDVYLKDEEVKKGWAEIEKQKKIYKEQECKMKASPAWKELELQKKNQEKKLEIQKIENETFLNFFKIIEEFEETDVSKISSFQLKKKIGIKKRKLVRLERYKQRKIENVLKK